MNEVIVIYRLMFIYNDGCHPEYYCGGTYIYDREKYAVVSENWKKAKLFKSEKMAQNAYDKLYKSCINVGCACEIQYVEDAE